MKRVLECSSKGDNRFSAFHAKVTILGKTDIIENHYQLSKRFGDKKPTTWRDAKGRSPTHFVVEDCTFQTKLLTAWYILLWVKYLDANPELVDYASEYDEFSDAFAKKSINNQADAIRMYVKDGRASIFDRTDVKELISMFRIKHAK